QAPLGANVAIRESIPDQHDATYHRISGKASTIRDHYNALYLVADDPDGRKMGIEARAYDDAVAFRYLVPELPGGKEFRLVDEHTEFRFQRDPNLFALFLPN